MFVADLSYRDRKRVGFVCHNQMSIGKVFQVIYAHTISRISGRDNFVEYIGNGVGFRKVGWVGSVKIVAIESKMWIFKATANSLRTHKVEMISKAINTFGGNGEFQRAIFGCSIVGDCDISVAGSQIVDRLSGIPCYPVDL